MVTSRVPALIDYLLAAFAAAPTIGAATPPVTVFDGPPTTADPAPLTLYVGMDDVFADTPPVSADSQQTRTGLGIGKREEVAAIHCVVLAWSGTDDMKTTRVAAFAVLAAVEDLVRANTDKFGGNGDLAEPGVSAVVLSQNNTQQGGWAQVAFTITFKCFIGN